ncbi:MAG TPA: hypothetical protein VN081_06945 [Dongiaceae bacterium]|nr:hypothetical protein [Dongiaceae bacterium]
MSALDDIIARDSAPTQGSVLDIIIARDSGNSQTAAPQQAPTQAAQSKPGMMTSFGAGLGHGVGSTVLGAQQLLGHGAQAIGLNKIGDWLAKDAETGLKNINSQYSPYSEANPISAATGDIGGSIAATIPLTALAPEMTTASLMQKIGVGAALGAANGAVAPVSDQSSPYWQQKAAQIGLGGAVGGVAAPVASGIGKMISGFGGDAQQQLAQKGVVMTPGQILGGGAQRTEDKLTSVPVVGDLIKNAQQRSLQSFNKATYDEVLAPLGQKYSGPVGNEGIEVVKNTISNAYDDALSKMTFRATDPVFQADVSKLAGMAQNLPESQKATFMNVLKTQIFGKVSPQGVMDGQTLKGVQNELSRITRGYSGDASFDNRQLGAAIGEIKNAVDSSISRYNPADAVNGLAKANAAYANFVRLRGAAASQGAMNNGGIFTAAQLSNAVRGADKSVGKGASATGKALMQDFSTAGQEVLGSKYPDSGTAGRSLLGIGAAALAGHEFLPASVLAPAAVGGAAVAAPYTKMGQKIAQALLMKRNPGAKAIGGAVDRYVAPLTPALSAALLNGSNR